MQISDLELWNIFVGSFWWKSGGKLLVKNILWKIFGRLGRDQLTGGDELTGRGQVDWGDF